MDIKNFKIAIGIPHTDVYMWGAFFDSWVLMKKPDNYVYIRPQFPGQVDVVRNDIVEQAIHERCTHLFMFDTDQTYSSDVLERLMSHKKPIVTGMVHRRYEPFDPILFKRTSEGEKGYSRLDDEEWENNKLVEVDFTGFACSLIETWVFREISYPWFLWRKNKEKRERIGEDAFFCNKLKDAGFRIFVDTTLRIGHLGPFEITTDFYKLYKALNMRKYNKQESS